MTRREANIIESLEEEDRLRLCPSLVLRPVRDSSARSAVLCLGRAVRGPADERECIWLEMQLSTL